MEQQDKSSSYAISSYSRGTSIADIAIDMSIAELQVSKLIANYIEGMRVEELARFLFSKRFD